MGLGVLALLAAVLLFSGGQPAHAATFTVTKTADTNDGVCDADCSLREAIGAANALAGADTITLPAGTYTLSIAGAGEDANATGDLDITDDLTLTGAGADSTIIQAATVPNVASDRVLEVHCCNVNISDVTIRHGKTGLGGGIHIGGSATVTITNSTISGNNSIATGGFPTGGGIWNEGTLTITNSTVSGNAAQGGGGGGILNQGTSIITDSTISGNRAGDGGGIYNNNGAVLTLINSTVNNNRTAGGGVGGGINNFSGSTLTIANSTISGNQARQAGGIYHRSGTLTITNSTITGNAVTTPATGGGGILNQAALTLTSTIIAGNTAPNSPDCNGFTSLGYNLIGNSSGCSFTPAIGDLSNTNPLLGPLRDNGGPTQTHALLAGSPAIDAGSSDCPPPATDQRGVVRPQGAACDIGAFELEALVIAVDIDIKPGSDPNSINPKSRGKIPVAILSTAAFDAPSEVDKASVTFGRTGGEPSLYKCNKSAEDVNGDGLLDQVCHFYTQLTDFQCGDTAGVLKGQTVAGLPIEGTDSVRIVKC